jgi:hypothetical protein
VTGGQQAKAVSNSRRSGLHDRARSKSRAGGLASLSVHGFEAAEPGTNV